MTMANLIWRYFYYPRLRFRNWRSSLRSRLYLWRFDRMTPEQRMRGRLRLGLRLDRTIELYLRETRERLGLAIGAPSRVRIPPGAEAVERMIASLEKVASVVSDRRLLEACFVESELAKQLLRLRGYGVTGTGLLETVVEAIQDLEDRKAKP